MGESCETNMTRLNRGKKNISWLLLPVLASFSLLLFPEASMAADDAEHFHPIKYGQAREIGILADRQIDESSGLARSIRNPGKLWTHNDSGDLPRLFLIDRTGQTLATFIVERAQAIDWEDIAIFKHGEQSYLLIGDVGDNAAQRDIHFLYLVPEPRVDKDGQSRDSNCRVSLAIPFVYEDGSHNCESVAVDPSSGVIYLASKERRKQCRVYELSLPTEEVTEPLVARAIARLEIPKTTAMDISPDGLRAVVLTYKNAYEYTRGEHEEWAAGFARGGRVLTMPEREQGESICYGADGKTLYLTSEGVREPLWEIPVTPDE